MFNIVLSLLFMLAVAYFGMFVVGPAISNIIDHLKR